MSNRLVTIAVRSPKLEATLARALLKDVETAFAKGADRIVIDLSLVKYIDSLGVAALVACLRYAPTDGAIALASLGPYVHTVAQITHLADVFSIYTTASAAETALTS